MATDSAPSDLRRQPDCVFCEILYGLSPASFVAREPGVTAFMDINPVTPGHVLVVSNDHYSGLGDTPPSVMQDIMELAQRCARAIEASDVQSEGMNLFLADGAVAFQEIFHVHLHVFPRFRGDSFRIRADWNLNPSRADLDSTAASIVAQLEK